MAEYIEREAAMEWARLTYCKDCNSYNGVRCRACEFDDTLGLIEVYPAADVVEVVHGEWIKQKKYLYQCSLCGDSAFISLNNKPCNYCPNCGAKMDAERKCDNDG